jgi:iron(III) transport system substrate-binding protein
MAAIRPCPRWLPALVGLGLWLAACAPARPGAPAPQPAASAPAAGTEASAAPADPFTAAKAMSWEELHAKALTEGGVLSLYATIAPATAEKILPRFEQRFPGVKAEQIDATADQLVARIITEGRGGRTLADVFHNTIDSQLQLDRQGLLLAGQPPEALALPEDLRGNTWAGVALQFIVAGWNTNQVRPDEAPRQWEDFADPRWRGRIMIEPRDVELFLALNQKYQSEEQAAALLRRIAANDPEFHRGHSDLSELLVAGQRAACLTCYVDHFPPRIRRGAPIEPMLTEGIGLITASSILKGAPHPYTAMLWQRWVTSPEGQQVYADAGRTPAHPNVEPLENVRPQRVYALRAEDIPNMNKYEGTWKEIFQLR